MGRGRFVGATAGGLLLIAAAGLPAVNSLGAAPQPPFTPAERAAIGSLALATLPPLPADPTNRFADVAGRGGARARRCSSISG